jgi:hypothetical protein
MNDLILYGILLLIVVVATYFRQSVLARIVCVLLLWAIAVTSLMGLTTSKRLALEKARDEIASTGTSNLPAEFVNGANATQFCIDRFLGPIWATATALAGLALLPRPDKATNT